MPHARVGGLDLDVKVNNLAILLDPIPSKWWQEFKSEVI